MLDAPLDPMGGMIPPSPVPPPLSDAASVTPPAKPAEAGPTLDEAIIGSPSAKASPRAKLPSKALSNEQILGVFGSVFARGLDPLSREQFVEAYKGDELVNLGLEFVDLGGALAELGLTVGSESLNPWVKVGIGAAALIGGGLLLRSSYAQSQTSADLQNLQQLAQRDPEQARAALIQLGLLRPDSGFSAADTQPTAGPTEEPNASFAV